MLAGREIFVVVNRVDYTTYFVHTLETQHTANKSSSLLYKNGVPQNANKRSCILAKFGIPHTVNNRRLLLHNMKYHILCRIELYYCTL